MAELNERKIVNIQAVEFFEDIWKSGDNWRIESDEFEQAKCLRLLQLLRHSRYTRALEIGCGAGHFTRMLSRGADFTTAIDIAPAAIARAKTLNGNASNIEFQVGNIMDHDFRADRPWDLIVMNETIYYLGWLYPFFDVAWMAHELFNAMASGGTFLMSNTYGDISDYLIRPWIIRTYRDLFVNVGCVLKSEEVFPGIKDGVPLHTLICIFTKP
jgi:predicted TPR repeat methyltransferase